MTTKTRDCCSCGILPLLARILILKGYKHTEICELIGLDSNEKLKKYQQATHIKITESCVVSIPKVTKSNRANEQERVRLINECISIARTVIAESISNLPSRLDLEGVRVSRRAHAALERVSDTRWARTLPRIGERLEVISRLYDSIPGSTLLGQIESCKNRITASQEEKRRRKVLAIVRARDVAMRKSACVALYECGATIPNISNTVGISSSIVHSVIQNACVGPITRRRSRLYKATDLNIREWKQMRREGMSLKQIAAVTGVSQTVIKKNVPRHTYAVLVRMKLKKDSIIAALKRGELPTNVAKSHHVSVRTVYACAPTLANVHRRKREMMKEDILRCLASGMTRKEAARKCNTTYEKVCYVISRFTL